MFLILGIFSLGIALHTIHYSFTLAMAAVDGATLADRVQSFLAIIYYLPRGKTTLIRFD